MVNRESGKLQPLKLQALQDVYAEDACELRTRECDLHACRGNTHHHALPPHVLLVELHCAAGLHRKQQQQCFQARARHKLHKLSELKASSAHHLLHHGTGLTPSNQGSLEGCMPLSLPLWLHAVWQRSSLGPERPMPPKALVHTMNVLQTPAALPTPVAPTLTWLQLLNCSSSGWRGRRRSTSTSSTNGSPSSVTNYRN